MQRAYRMAFIDIGSNAARLAIYQADSHTQPELIRQERIVTRLGSYDSSGCLTQAAMQRGLSAGRRLTGFARQYGATSIEAVATAAVRDAPNRREFQERFNAVTGIRLRIISGQEEARMVYRGLATGLPVSSPVLMLDIGGGSTELIVGNSRRMHTAISLPLGAVRLTEYFQRLQRQEPASHSLYRHIQAHVRATAGPQLTALRRYHPSTAIGVAGAIRAVGILARRYEARKLIQDTYGNQIIEIGLAGKIACLLCGMQPARLRELPGLEPDRADIIVAGTAILDVILRDLQIRRLVISYRGLRDGWLADHGSGCSDESAGTEGL